VERLERLDEKELMQQLFEHYCVTVGWRNGADINLVSKHFSSPLVQN
jgi:hypothetical protein